MPFFATYSVFQKAKIATYSVSSMPLFATYSDFSACFRTAINYKNTIYHSIEMLFFLTFFEEAF